MKKKLLMDISVEIDSEGTPLYWLNFLGCHASQGGYEFCYGGEYGSTEMAKLLEYYLKQYNKDKLSILGNNREKKK